MSSETALRETPVVSRLRRIAGEVAEFANAEAAASGLPGHVNGPQDAYRHLVGVGELARRIGALQAWVLAEYNEQVSRRAMLRSERLGLPVAPANTRESRAMDRANNRLAIGIGMTARSPEEVVQRARRAFERAHSIHSGSGADGSAFWHPRSMWIGDADVAWSLSPSQWPAVESEHFLRYVARTRPAANDNPGRSTFVDPHLRGGQPVAGHWRRIPGG
jgi:hypothetical protein